MFVRHPVRQQKGVVEGRGVETGVFLVSPVILDIVMFFVLLLVRITVLQRFVMNVVIIITICKNGVVHD